MACHATGGRVWQAGPVRCRGCGRRPRPPGRPPAREVRLRQQPANLPPLDVPSGSGRDRPSPALRSGGRYLLSPQRGGVSREWDLSVRKARGWLCPQGHLEPGGQEGATGAVALRVKISIFLRCARVPQVLVVESWQK